MPHKITQGNNSVSIKILNKRIASHKIYFLKS